MGDYKPNTSHSPNLKSKAKPFITYKIIVDLKQIRYTYSWDHRSSITCGDSVHEAIYKLGGKCSWMPFIGVTCIPAREILAYIYPMN